MISPFEIIDGVKQYNFKKSLIFLEQMGKHHYGDRFMLHPEDKEILYKLIIYAIQDQENCEKHNISLDKGILLTGPVGCGKTTLMQLIKYFMPAKQGYILKPAREVVFEFNTHGHEIIQRHSRLNSTYCFDDLGVEQRSKYYGNECNVIGEILLSRYDLFIHNKTKTHATTNLNATELEKLYGNRVRSRMREMFNLIAFSKNTGDKRK